MWGLLPKGVPGSPVFAGQVCLGMFVAEVPLDPRCTGEQRTPQDERAHWVMSGIDAVWQSPNVVSANLVHTHDP